MKTFVVIFSIACVAFGIYAWFLRQQSFDRLEQLEQNGINVDLRIESRPIMVIDQDRAQLYLIGLGTIKEIAFDNITEITFEESPETGNNASLPRGADTATIKTQTQTYKITELPHGAEDAKAFFDKYTTVSDKTNLKTRRP